jgi:hypothetical protein
VYTAFLDPSLSSEMDDQALRRDQHHETFVYEPLGDVVYDHEIHHTGVVRRRRVHSELLLT